MSFTNFIQLQEDFAHLLLSDDWLRNVNVVTRDRLVLDASRAQDQTLAAEVLAYMTPRNGRCGCGIIVEKPELQVALENVPGPQGDIYLTCLVIEDPLINEAPDTGSLVPADQAGQRILDLAHLWTVEGFGIYRSDRAALREASEWQPLRAYATRLRLACNRGQTERCARVAITTANGQATLTCTTANAVIYYTLNAPNDPNRGCTFPGQSNPSALEYTEPFAATSGQIIRAAAYKTDLTPSPIAQKTIS